VIEESKLGVSLSRIAVYVLREE